MRAVEHVAPRQVEVVEVPDPDPGPGQAVVAMRASGICGSDLHPYRRGPGKDSPTKIHGHEPSGIVARLGKGVKHLEVGQRVMLYHFESCGLCSACRAGNRMYCVDRGGFGWHVPGAHADMKVTGAQNCLPLPNDLSFVDGAIMACAGGTTWSAFEKVNPSARDLAVVFGLGPVGLAGVILLRAMGARVLGVGRRSSRLDLARQLGAELAVDIDAEEKPPARVHEVFPEGATLAYETSGAAEAQRQMLAVLRTYGRAVCVGIGNREPAFNLGALTGKQVTLKGSWVMTPAELEALGHFLAAHKVSLERMVTHRYPIEKAQEAYEMADHGDCGKVVFEWPNE